jgi:hypothetical protein
VKFLQINTNNKSAGELESALLELNRDEEEQDNAQG